MYMHHFEIDLKFSDYGYSKSFAAHICNLRKISNDDVETYRQNPVLFARAEDFPAGYD